MSSEANAGERGPVDRRLALLDELRQTERRAAVSRVASVIGHLIGTPLNVIAGRAALIRANPAGDSAAENARRIEEQVERLAERIRRLIDYLTVPETPPEAKATDVVVREALSLYEPVAAEHNVRVLVMSEALPTALVEGMSALVVLTSLMSLALRVAPAGSDVELRVEQTSASTMTFELRVPGLEPPRARLDRLDPPDDEDGEGAERLQLLSLCFAMARRQGGRLEVLPHESQHAAIRFECALVSG